MVFELTHGSDLLGKVGQTIDFRRLPSVTGGGRAKRVWQTTKNDGLPHFSPLQLDNSAAHSDRNRLRPVTGAQLVHNVFDVNLDGFL